jgi:hypothetical protein
MPAARAACSREKDVTMAERKTAAAKRKNV